MARGRFQLPSAGAWKLQFYIGVPEYKRRARNTPAAFPDEKDATPSPEDLLTVSINGVNETFSTEGMANGGKLIYMKTFPFAAVLDYTFVFKSDTALEHLHMFAANGELAFLGAANTLPTALLHLPGGQGEIGGTLINAIDGHPLIPGALVSDGYSGGNRAVQVPVEAPVLRLMFGNAEMYQIPIVDGKFSKQVKAGGFACQVTLKGFYAFFDRECSIRDSADVSKVIALSPLLNPGSMRFILSWGSHPHDLDMMLTMPGDRCMVWWKRKQCHGLAALDFDVTAGYGPETITIAGVERGRYFLVVEHYKGDREVDRQRDMSPAVENSGAQIAFYFGNSVKRMVVGEDGYLKHKFWVVLRFDSESQEITTCTPEVCPIDHAGIIRNT